jgi:hypothetical protein
MIKEGDVPLFKHYCKDRVELGDEILPYFMFLFILLQLIINNLLLLIVLQKKYCLHWFFICVATFNVDHKTIILLKTMVEVILLQEIVVKDQCIQFFNEQQNTYYCLNIIATTKWN